MYHVSLFRASLSLQNLSDARAYTGRVLQGCQDRQDRQETRIARHPIGCSHHTANLDVAAEFFQRNNNQRGQVFRLAKLLDMHSEPSCREILASTCTPKLHGGRAQSRRGASGWSEKAATATRIVARQLLNRGQNHTMSPDWEGYSTHAIFTKHYQ